MLACAAIANGSINEPSSSGSNVQVGPFTVKDPSSRLSRRAGQVGSGQNMRAKPGVRPDGNGSMRRSRSQANANSTAATNVGSTRNSRRIR